MSIRESIQSPWLVALLLAMAAMGASLLANRVEEVSAQTLRPDDSSLVGRGEVIYVAHCAACHGARLEGQPDWRRRRPDGRLPAPPHDETGHTWHHADELLVRLTRDGPQAVAGKDYASDMPAFAGTLSDSEIVAVLSYIKSRWPVSTRARHDELNAQAAR
jgi:mono/diheme cytochrome c family protein